LQPNTALEPTPLAARGIGAILTDSFNSIVLSLQSAARLNGKALGGIKATCSLTASATLLVALRCYNCDTIITAGRHYL
jgi:hypothetical protein